jgi:hypothetical protein
MLTHNVLPFKTLLFSERRLPVGDGDMHENLCQQARCRSRAWGNAIVQQNIAIWRA